MKLVKDNEMKCFLKQLELFDLNFVDGDKALYFDDKHNLKRMRTSVISDKRGTKISGTVLAKDQLKYVMEKANSENFVDARSQRQAKRATCFARAVTIQYAKN